MNLKHEIRNITKEESVILELFSIANNNKQNFLPIVEKNQELDFFYKQKQGGKEYYCIFIDNEIAGVCVLKDIMILHIYVVEKFRGRKIGTALLEYLKEQNKNLSLFISKENNGGREFYLNNGFSITETNSDSLRLLWSEDKNLHLNL